MLSIEELTREMCGYVENETAKEYIRAHARRFHETIGLIPVDRPLNVLDLGAFIPLTVLLKRITPHTYTLHGATGTEPLSEMKIQNEVLRVHHFDVELEPFPFGADVFDMVLCAEVLEHLGLDPFFMMTEINRVLRPGGLLLLTTPNIVSTRNTVKALLGYAPYFYSAFTLSRDRHNREYTPGEVMAMLACSGFQAKTFLTRNVYYPSNEFRMSRLLAAVAVKLLLRVLNASSLRGDAIFMLAQKTGPATSRYPELFYDIGSHDARPPVTK